LRPPANHIDVPDHQGAPPVPPMAATAVVKGKGQARPPPPLTSQGPVTSIGEPGKASARTRLLWTGMSLPTKGSGGPMGSASGLESHQPGCSARAEVEAATSTPPRAGASVLTPGLGLKSLNIGIHHGTGSPSHGGKGSTANGPGKKSLSDEECQRIKLTLFPIHRSIWWSS